MSNQEDVDTTVCVTAKPFGIWRESEIGAARDK